MLNDFLNSFSEIYSLIERQKTYITSKEIKEKISDFYKTNWLPISQDFKIKFGESSFNFVENNLFELYRSTKSNVLVKKRLLAIFKVVEPVLDGIQIEIIRKYGVVIEYDKKKQIVEELLRFQFNGTLTYLRNSEKDFQTGDWKDCCFNARLAIEEFMREFREKLTKKPVKNGTLGNHIPPIKNKIPLKDSEIKLINEGFYGFLSEKGGHATTDVPDREDSVISIYLIYIISDYLLKKYSSFI
jgi:hypothetical protein